MFGSFYICDCVSTILFVYVSDLNRKTCYIRLVYCSDHLHMYKKLDFESIDSVVVFCGYSRGFFSGVRKLGDCFYASADISINLDGFSLHSLVIFTSIF